MDPITGSLLVAGAGGMAAGGSILGEKSKDESELIREEPPERKYANSLLQLISARALSGRKGMADLMEEARMRADMERQLGGERQDMLRRYGMMGVESPGMANRLSEMGTSGMTSLINASNQANLERRRGAISMLDRLLGENQPYEKEVIKEAPMKYKMLSSALPAMGSAMGGMGAGKMAGGAGGGVNPTEMAGKATGSTSQLGSMLPSILGGGGSGQATGTSNIKNKGRVNLGSNIPPSLQLQPLQPQPAIQKGQAAISGNRLKAMGLEQFNLPYEGLG